MLLHCLPWCRKNTISTNPHSIVCQSRFLEIYLDNVTHSFIGIPAFPWVHLLHQTFTRSFLSNEMLMKWCVRVEGTLFFSSRIYLKQCNTLYKNHDFISNCLGVAVFLDFFVFWCCKRLNQKNLLYALELHIWHCVPVLTNKSVKNLVWNADFFWKCCLYF